MKERTKLSALFACFVLSSTLAFGQAIAPTPSIRIDPSFHRHGIRVEGFGSPQFQPLVEALIGKEVARKVSPIIPSLLIVSNNSKHTIVRMVSRYLRTDRDGKVVVGVADLDTRGRTAGFAPGAIVIQAPQGLLSQTLNAAQRGESIDVDAAAESAAAAAQYIFEPQFYKDPVITLDSVVFENGEVAGPDVFGVIDELTARQAAVRELSLRFADRDMGDDDLEKWLGKKAKAGFEMAKRSDGTASHNHFQFQISQLSGVLENAVRQVGRAKASEFLDNIAQQIAATELKKVED